MSLTISMDDALKADFSDVCSEIGLSVSTAMNVFARKVVREKRIPFELSSIPDAERLSREDKERERRIAAALSRAYADLQAGATYSLSDLEQEHARRHGDAHYV